MSHQTYRVVARWDGREWMIRVEDDHGYHRGDATARRLEQVESRARAVVADGGSGRRGGVDVAVEVLLPPHVEQRFVAAEDLVREASREVDDIVAGLRSLSLAAQDIVMMLRGRPLRAEPRRPLVIPNAEVAACGLDCRPDVIAVQWEDRGFGATTYCRECVAEDRSAWRDLPHGASAVFYEGPVVCDVCGQVAAADDDRQAGPPRRSGWSRQ